MAVRTWLPVPTPKSSLSSPTPTACASKTSTTSHGNNAGLNTDESPDNAFREFKALVSRFYKDAPEYHPHSWSEQKMRGWNMQSRHWADLACAVKEHDINEHYGPMTMQLKMLVEELLASNPSRERERGEGRH
ncbi:MAG: hypothetical protein M1831_005305 [Alyxoria varia]|nr:MAG: hypothetical protein M1831_005305 [Alyxoria varia]